MGFRHVLPLILASITCALFAGVIEYAAGHRPDGVYWLFRDTFSGVDLTSVLMAFWMLALGVYWLAGSAKLSPAAGVTLFMLPSVFGLAATAWQIVCIFLAVRMWGPEAPSVDIGTYAHRLTLALALLSLTLAGLAGQTATEVNRQAQV